MLGLKLFAFWNDADSFDNYDVMFIKQNFPSLLNLPLARFWLVVTLAAFAVASGGWIFKQQRSGSMLLLTCALFYMCSVLIFYVTDRYRLPIVIFLLPLAGAAAPFACMLWSQKKKNSLLIACGTAFLFLLAALSPPLKTDDLAAFDWGTLTSIYADKGDKEHTLDAFQKGRTLSAERIGSQAYIRAAEIYELANQKDRAAQLFQQAAQLFPQDGVVLYNLGRLQAMQGHFDDAITTLHQAIEHAPTYGLSYFALASIYAQQGDMPAAREALHIGLAADPEDEHLLSLEETWRSKP